LLLWHLLMLLSDDRYQSIIPGGSQDRQDEF
jgi:hypothetical protein